MVARLPVPNSDTDIWGEILNDYLLQSHNPDGTLKTAIVTTSTVVDQAITEAKLDLAVQTKLNSMAPVTSVAGRTGAVSLTKSDVDLANVDNTSDLDKPISSATQTALTAKADDSNVVHRTGVETIAGNKTFTSNLGINTTGTPSSPLTVVNSASTPVARLIGQYSSGGQRLIHGTSTYYSDPAITLVVSGDSMARLNIYASGKLEWGQGYSTMDTNLYRSAANTLKTDGKLIAMTGLDANNARITSVGTPTVASDAVNKQYVDSIVHTASEITDFTEAAQDVIGSTLVAGTNIALNYDDAANTLTISATGSAAGGATDITTTADASTVTVVSSSGADGILGGATTSAAGVMTAADKSKLDGIATGATANQSDAYLLDRVHHTGTQAIATITDLQTTLDTKVASSSVGVASGVASLDASGKLPSTQIPQTYAQILRYSTRTGFPTTGMAATLYVATDTENLYEWTGTIYAQLSPSDVTSVAGRTGAVTLTKSDVGLSNVDNTADTAKTFAATQITSGLLDPARLPAGGVMYSASTTRPTTRTDVMVIFTTTADPGSNAKSGDLWVAP